MEGVGDSNWPASNFSSQEDIYLPHRYNGPQTITTTNSAINFSGSEFVQTLPPGDLSNDYVAFNWPIPLQETYGMRYADISTCFEATNYINDENIEPSFHDLFTNAGPSSELSVMPISVAESPSYNILGYVLSYQSHSLLSN